ncbi:AMP nucleosidase [Sneathiella chungangensis]|uniref:AMP nucleosidase n=1 Tax=Sneathiella chungangensis TaxID=1418234 RepID=A0A845MK57_9PROT|nr:AMP nucleosidase [Sneathiella chungangensis]MZR23992.1 AMP nucleosidase [Sneathiella chungangensis]
MSEFLTGTAQPHGNATDLQEFTDAEAAFDYIKSLYEANIAKVKHRFARFEAGDKTSPAEPGYYPYLGLTVESTDITRSGKRSYGKIDAAGTFGTTLTQPDLFESYYKEQIRLILKNHQRPVYVGLSNRQMPLPFVIEAASSNVSADDIPALQAIFTMPELANINDSIANGTFVPAEGLPRPLALFTAERVDYSLARLSHYTGTVPEYFQRFVLFTNYQRYVDEFIEYGKKQVLEGDEYHAFVEPGNVVTPNPQLTDRPPTGTPPGHLPQMPAYHLVGERHMGITLVNIGVGPSNAKTITDHIAVLRPHCWLMVGHCGGLRHTQRLGDFVLAHAYVREDHVLDEDLHPSIPLPAIAEIQVALTDAVARAADLSTGGADIKEHFRTGTVYTTDDRDWELRHKDLAIRFNQSRAIAVDMESATIAANGFRFRVPYGTLLCVSDKPIHGEIKLPGMANKFYQDRTAKHLHIGIDTLRQLRLRGVESLHSRKLRSFDEPAFR